MQLTFPRRAEIRLTGVARHRIWTAVGRMYRVVHSRPTVGHGRGEFRAERWDAWQPGHGCWEPISRHRSKDAALAACQAAAKLQTVRVAQLLTDLADHGGPTV